MLPIIQLSSTVKVMATRRAGQKAVRRIIVAVWPPNRFGQQSCRPSDAVDLQSKWCKSTMQWTSVSGRRSTRQRSVKRACAGHLTGRITPKPSMRRRTKIRNANWCMSHKVSPHLLGVLRKSSSGRNQMLWREVWVADFAVLTMLIPGVSEPGASRSVNPKSIGCLHYCVRVKQFYELILRPYWFTRI